MTRSSPWTAALLLALATGIATTPTAAQRYPKLAPYPALRYQGDTPEVRHDDRWCELVAINGIPVVDILAHSEKAHGDRGKERFAEDLVQVMAEMGKRPGTEVELSLIDLETGKPFKAEGVAMTEANRQSVRSTWERGGRPAAAAARPFQLDGHHPTRSPFRAMRRADGRLEVQVDDDKWYEWLALEGVDADEIQAWCRQNCADPHKRITEDLVAVLAQMGHDVGREASLDLRDLSTGKKMRLEKVAMTGEKRQMLWQANNGRGSSVATPATMSAAAVAADLRQLRGLLDERFSYRSLRGVDLQALIAETQLRLGDEPVSTVTFAREVDGIIAAFGDGHAGVRDSAALLDRGYLPFLVEQAKDGLVALSADRTGFVDSEHPYLTAIDGEPVEKWIETAQTLVNRGSPQYERRGAVRNLRNLQHLRGLRNLPKSERVEVSLTDGETTVERELALYPRRPTYGTWPRGATSWLRDGTIGYLRIPTMAWDPESAEFLDATMTRFRKTEGLIIDVRGNGGGSRGALRHLFPYFMAEDDAPRVANVAAYRLPKGEDPHRPEGFLQNRYLYPANQAGWSEPARESIVAASRAFRPQWHPPAGQFSGWHFMVLERSANPKAYHYDKPVAVLMNADCFSATDVFLGAFKGWHDVTLIGTPSGGGSGRTQTYSLERSGIRLRLSSMASFQPGGRLYDGNGIEPDVTLVPRAGDFIGRGDTVLEAALQHFGK